MMLIKNLSGIIGVLTNSMRVINILHSIVHQHQPPP